LTTPEEFQLAIDAAKQVFPGWRNTPVTSHQCIMFKLQELIRRDMEKLAVSVTTEQGKTLGDAHLQHGKLTNGRVCGECVIWH
jgi:malonate-semialdehyde dehydrogenase (acetylating)/methylmalonate-semialdehyde dehydrogenase